MQIRQARLEKSSSGINGKASADSLEVAMHDSNWLLGSIDSARAL